MSRPVDPRKEIPCNVRLALPVVAQVDDEAAKLDVTRAEVLRRTIESQFPNDATPEE